MSIESELKKDGITIIEPLDKLSINTIANNVSKKLVSTFPNIGFNFDTLFERFSNLPMYIANIPEGMSEASYFYKNSSIYFRDGMGLNDLEKFSVHELIHNLQEVKDKKENLLRLGLCKFNGSKREGLALNEAAVQLLTSNILGETFENVTYYDINFSTISPNCYPIVCNLIYQMAYITGEDVLFDSTFNSNDHFENKFTALCGEHVYYKISNFFDNILNIEEKIINLNNKIQNLNLSNSKLDSLYKKVKLLKEQLRTTYFETQELIIKSYFSNEFKSLLTSVDIDKFRKKLYNFQELIGTTNNYTFFNNYYIDMMKKLDTKFDILSCDSTSKSTYLIDKKENLFIRFINYLKKIFCNKNTEYIDLK